MGALIYTALMSLDGYVADRDSDFSWAEPDEEVHSFISELERSVGTYLLRSPHARGHDCLADHTDR